MEQLGKFLVITSLALAALGVFLCLGGGRWLQWFGRLPGDIHVDGPRGSFHFPVVTCILVSIGFSAVLALVRKFSGN